MDILSILERHGWSARKKAFSKGDLELKGECPWCGEGRDRFIVWPTRLDYMGKIKGFFWCRVCGHKGNAFNLLVDIYGMEVDEAREYLLGDVRDIDIVKRTKTYDYQKKTCKYDETPAEEWQAVLRSKILFFSNELHSKYSSDTKKETQQFLRERGITDSISKRAQIGINIKTHEVDIPGFDDKILLPKGMYIPVYNNKNELLRVKVRRFPSDIVANPQYSKYTSIHGSCQKSIGIFKLCSAVSFDRDLIWVTESELDAICMSAQGNGHVIPTSTKSLFPFVFSYCLKNNINAIFVLDSEPHPFKKDGEILYHPLIKDMLDRNLINTNKHAIAHFSKKDACQLAVKKGIKRVGYEMDKMKAVARNNFSKQ